MQDISAFGFQIRLIASFTFPTGITITEFSDDGDPFDIPAIQIADKSMGINGDLIVWSTAKPIDVTLSIIPDSESDDNLSILLANNRPSRGKLIVNDMITLTGIYPDRSNIILQNGRLTNGMPGKSISTSGRIKTRPYTFTFESNVGVG